MTAVINPPLSIGRVALTVHDLDRVSAFYRQAVGFRLLAETPDSVQLGTGSGILLELRRDRQARRSSPADAGLYLVAARTDPGSFYRHAVRSGLPIRTSDHLVAGAFTRGGLRHAGAAYGSRSVGDVDLPRDAVGMQPCW